MRYFVNQAKPFAPGSCAAWGLKCHNQTLRYHANARIWKMSSTDNNRLCLQSTISNTNGCKLLSALWIILCADCRFFAYTVEIQNRVSFAAFDLLQCVSNIWNCHCRLFWCLPDNYWCWEDLSEELDMELGYNLPPVLLDNSDTSHIIKEFPWMIGIQADCINNT